MYRTRIFHTFAGISQKEYSQLMKAKLVLISILTLLVTSLSSCFIKKLFKKQQHFNDHRGVYKDKGMTKSQMAFNDEMMRVMHPKKYRKKKHIKTHVLKEDHKALAKPRGRRGNSAADTGSLVMPKDWLNSSDSNNHTGQGIRNRPEYSGLVDSNGHPLNSPQNSAPVQSPADTSNRNGQAPPPAVPEQQVDSYGRPVDQNGQPIVTPGDESKQGGDADKKDKKKKKKKKTS